MPLGHESHSCGTLDAVQTRQISPMPQESPLQAVHACICVHGVGHCSSQGRIQLGSDAEVSSAQQAALERILSRPCPRSSAGDSSTMCTAQSIRCGTGVCSRVAHLICH